MVALCPRAHPNPNSSSNSKSEGYQHLLGVLKDAGAPVCRPVLLLVRLRPPGAVGAWFAATSAARLLRLLPTRASHCCCCCLRTVVTIAYDRISTNFWWVMPMLRVPKKPRFFGPSLCWMASSSCRVVTTAQSEAELLGEKPAAADSCCVHAC